METNSTLAQIIQRLNHWLSDPSLLVTEENALFVRDAAVKYPTGNRSRCYGVRQEDLIPAEKFSWAFGDLLSGGPSWIHANLIPFGESRFLITIIAGAKIGNPHPSINISYEPDKTAEILSTKTLVTTS